MHLSICLSSSAVMTLPFFEGLFVAKFSEVSTFTEAIQKAVKNASYTYRYYR